MEAIMLPCMLSVLWLLVFLIKSQTAKRILAIAHALRTPYVPRVSEMLKGAFALI